MTSLIGYARVSSQDQDLTIQRAALEAAGCSIIREEKASGTKRTGRAELEIVLGFLRKGDTLVVTRIDRLARSVKDLQDIVHDLKGKGVTLKATEQPIDTSTAAGKCFLDMLAVFAEFETSLRRERQLEGIARIKSDPTLRRVKYKGRPPILDETKAQALEMASQERGPVFIAKALKISRHSVRKILKEAGR
jgi:DNA invertase Pin-like site-specific DNA recombinase